MPTKSSRSRPVAAPWHGALSKSLLPPPPLSSRLVLIASAAAAFWTGIAYPLAHTVAAGFPRTVMISLRHSTHASNLILPEHIAVFVDLQGNIQSGETTFETLTAFTKFVESRVASTGHPLVVEIDAPPILPHRQIQRVIEACYQGRAAAVAIPIRKVE